MHQRKDTLDLSGTNSRGRKSKLKWDSMATFSEVPHLITVSNYGGGMIPLDMLQTKWTWCSYWQDRLLASPIVHARKNTILEAMKAIGIPHHGRCPNYFWNNLCGSVGNLHKPTDFYDSEWTTRSCVDEPQCNNQFQYSDTNETPLLCKIHIMHKKISVRH